MKKKNPILSVGKTLLVAITCFLSFSCSDFFDPAQDLVQERDEHYDTVEKVRRATIGAYGQLQGLVESLVIMGDLRAELLTTTRNYDAFLEEIAEHNISPDNPYANPRPFYEVILNCNDVLSKMAKAEADPHMTEDLMFAYEAEIRTLRAWVYLQLIQTYKAVPVVKEAVDGNFPDYEPREYGEADMLNFLLAEMRWVIEQPLLDWRVFNEKNEEVSLPWRYTRINRKALLGELYLLTGNYQSASDILRDCIINAGEGKDDRYLKCSSLSGSISWGNNWETVTVNANHVSSLEHLTTIPFSKSNHQTNELLSIFSPLLTNKYLLKPTKVAVNNWKRQNNGNGDSFRGLGSSYFIYSGERADTVVNKYLRSKQGYLDDAVYTIYRAADLHLMYAEALNRTGRTDEALDVLNENLPGSPHTEGIRGRVSLEPVDLLDVADRNPEIGTQVELFEIALLEERALELAYEGKRWNSLMRFANRANRPEWLAKTVALKYREINPAKADELEAKLSDPSNWKLEMPRLKSSK
ncbi:hypothetical protein FUAX_15310 [Fulvitalea axinellae]|uniref:RagB/SusD domain-containing protein n=1 Tax=Fulvitalea axinellae TaxID=1182444 RepID=A0AAU9CRN3_9BACT|nr:hypothetical protein FUAX_15310 [Fulvitalea axinellae]